ncbi:hypothetical protein V6N13_049228 [Hibiscus sabdariffa]
MANETHWTHCCGSHAILMDRLVGSVVAESLCTDIDFNVFGGPPRRSSVQETQYSFGENLDSSSSGFRKSDETMVEHRNPWSGLTEKPVFREEGTTNQRRYSKNDFFDDNFRGNQSLTSSPRKYEMKDPFEPASQLLNPCRPLPPKSEPFSSSFPSQFRADKNKHSSPIDRRNEVNEPVRIIEENNIPKSELESWPKKIEERSKSSPRADIASENHSSRLNQVLPGYFIVLQAIDAKIRQWFNGKQGNIRSLLSTLQYVLWADSGWKPVPLTDIIEGRAVKKSYQKALPYLHPDELQQKGAASYKKYIAEKVFDILQAGGGFSLSFTSLQHKRCIFFSLRWPPHRNSKRFLYSQPSFDSVVAACSWFHAEWPSSLDLLCRH